MSSAPEPGAPEPGAPVGSAPRGIEVLDGVWDRCGELIDLLNGQDAWERSRVQGRRSEVDYRTSDTVPLTFAEGDEPAVVSDLIGAMRARMDAYAFVYGIPVHQYEDVIVNRYLPGQHFGMHPDYYRGSDRVFSGVLYLNTVQEGGVTSFPHFGYEVAAIEGRMAVFPANFLFAHAGTAPTTQVKYSAAIWARG